MLKKIIVFILTLESRLILAIYKPFIVAVTGSVGKTSTKDAIFEVLKKSEKFARKSDKSLNSEIGLPLTIIGVPNAWKNVGGWISNILAGLRLILMRREYPSCLILEVGADHPGDIQKVSKWLKPDIAVITRVSRTPVHVEFFASPEEVFAEKASLASGLKKGGALVLFADDEKVMSIKDMVADKEPKVISFGTSESATARGSNEMMTYTSGDSNRYVTGFSFKLDIQGNSVPIAVQGVAGTAAMYSLLAAAAVGIARGVPISQIVQGLQEYVPPKGRMNIIEGIKGATIIDDTYNSSPDAVMSAISALERIMTNGKHIIVLGDMMELGSYSVSEHRRIGKELANRVGILCTVGPRAKAIAEEVLQSGMSEDRVFTFDTAEQSADYIKSIIENGDVVLIKGSQSVRMERAVKALMKSPEKAEELLVRQEEEWLNKR